MITSLNAYGQILTGTSHYFIGLAMLCLQIFNYTDYPVAIQIYNHYRKHWIGAYLQDEGIQVIPTISWGEAQSFEWCFDGEPVGGTVAISSVGCMNSRYKKQLFLMGYQEMMQRLKPEQILCYGEVPEECKGNILRIRTFQDKFKT